MIIELLRLTFLICADSNHSLVQLFALLVKATMDCFKLLIHLLEALIHFSKLLIHFFFKCANSLIQRIESSFKISPVRPKQRLHQLLDIR